MSEPADPTAIDQPVLPFTGERFTPECVREIWYEHMHRYALAVTLAAGRRVLDAACGEGYGAALLAMGGIVLGAAYMLGMVQRVFFGPVSDTSAEMQDIGASELAILAPLAALILWIGVYPTTFLGPIQVASQRWLWMIEALAATVTP